MNQKKTKKLVDGAMITSLFGALFFLDMYLGGMIGYFLYFVLPTFIIWYNTKYTLKDTLIVGVSTIMVTFLLTSSPTNLCYVVVALMVGIGVRQCMNRHVHVITVYFTVFGLSILSNIIGCILVSKLLDIDLVLQLKSIYEMVSMYLPSYVTFDVVLKYSPLLLVFMSTVESYAMIVLMVYILPRLKITFPYRFNYLLMVLPRWIGYMGILLVTIHFFIQDKILLNYLYIMISFLIIMQGLSLAMLYFSLQKNFIFYMISVIVLFIFPLNKLYFVIGILDIFTGIKKRIMYNRFKI